MIRRAVAYFVDWYVVMIVMNIVLVTAAYSTTGVMYAGSLPLTFFAPEMQLPLLLVLICIEVVFYCIIPTFIWSGQTVGKRLLRIKVVEKNGNRAGFARLLLRDAFGIVLLEGCFSPLSNYMRNYLMLFFARDVIQYAIWFSWVVGAISVLILLFTRGLMLHDLIAGTKVMLVHATTEEPGTAEGMKDGCAVDGALE